MRASLAFVFVWFGVSEIVNPTYFRGYIPQFVSSLGFDNDLLIQIHGVLLVFLYVCLVFKIYIRFMSLAAVFVLGFIILGLLLTPDMGFNEIVVRDIGLLGLALAIWLNENK